MESVTVHARLMATETEQLMVDVMAWEMELQTESVTVEETARVKE